MRRYECQLCVGEIWYVPQVGNVFVHHYEIDDACYEDGADEICTFCWQDPSGCHSDDYGWNGEWCPSPPCEASQELIDEIAEGLGSGNAHRIARAVSSLPRKSIDLADGVLSIYDCGNALTKRFHVSHELQTRIERSLN
jgi:hypothetical protein